MKYFGIDISKWQGNFNFKDALNDGVSFAIIKGGGADDGLYKDSMFEENYSNSKKLNIPVGVYWYSKATNEKDAIAEADYLLDNILANKQFELPIFIDVEHPDMLNLGKIILTAVVDTWCSYLEKKGFWVGVYSSLYYFSKYMNDSDLKRYTHWVAQWAEKCTYNNPDILGFWQFGGNTNMLRSNKVANTVCDQDYMYFDFPSMIKNKKLNGFGKSVKSSSFALSQVKSDEQIANEVISGLWGVGTERKNKLSSAGYDYLKIQSIVNNILLNKNNNILIKAGDLAKMTPDAVVYGTNKKFAPFVYSTLLYVRELKNDRAVISIQPEGAVTGAVDVKYLIKVVS